MKKSLELLLDEALKGIKELTYWDCYYSDVIPDTRYKNYKYFIKFHNTNNVFRSFKTQRELEYFCNKVVNEKIILDEE